MKLLTDRETNKQTRVKYKLFGEGKNNIPISFVIRSFRGCVWTNFLCFLASSDVASDERRERDGRSSYEARGVEEAVSW